MADKLVAIVQARMGSTRLPGKVLMDLEGNTTLARVVRRLRRSHLIDRIVIATTTNRADDEIISECAQLKVESFRGSEPDALDRYYRAAQLFAAQEVVRVTSDCPLIDPQVVDETIEKFRRENADYASNSLNPTYPRGLDTEVFTMTALQTAWKAATLPHEREHVTPYFYANPDAFRVASLTSPADYSHYRWTLDTLEDLELLRTIYRRFDGADEFTWRDVVALMEKEPGLSEINSHVQQKSLVIL